MSNLYLVLDVGDIKDDWFSVLVQKSIDDCRRSLDGTQVVLKIPNGITSSAKVPQKYKTDWTKYKPKMINHKEAKALMATKQWTDDDLLNL